MSRSNTVASPVSPNLSDEYTLSSVAPPAKAAPVPRRGRRHGPNAVYDAVYLNTGVVVPQIEIAKLLERLDQASLTARRIDARQRKANGNHGGKYRSPTLRLAGLIKSIYDTLDRVHGEGLYVHDVREKLIPVSKISGPH
jgi:hypothetical protein